MSPDHEHELPVEQRDWYTIQEAADFLGVSQPTIFRWMKQGTLSFYKVGGSTRFSKQGLEAVVEKNTGGPEARTSSDRCAVCGNGELADGQLQGTGRIFFRPAKSRFWVMSESLVPTTSKVCTACGHVQIHADTAKLKKLLKPSK
jgi:excisionase family DNA binding protein